MVVLHTSDWHLGKKLHRVDLKQDHFLFFDWLLGVIEQYNVDVLLISGDIFDTAYPSQESLEAYYRFLSQLFKVECKVIVTGGNHDSPNTLNAPAELLKYLDIAVVGGLEKDFDKQLIPIYNQNREVELIVAAVPFLRDADLLLDAQAESREENAELVRKAILAYYNELALRCAAQYPTVPAIAMGHLFASGAITSESEREIQVGNLGAIDANDLPSYFGYYAFGHIHKAQWIGGLDFVRYCGSPIALSFTEANYEREVLLVNTEKNFTYQGRTVLVPQSIRIPEFRKLVRLKGSFAELENQLAALQHAELPTLVEIEVEEPGEANSLMPVARAFMKNHSSEQCWLIHHKINQIGKTHIQTIANQQTIHSITPEMVFDIVLQDKSEEEKKELQDLFAELWSIVQQEIQDTETLHRS